MTAVVIIRKRTRVRIMFYSGVGKGATSGAHAEASLPPEGPDTHAMV